MASGLFYLFWITMAVFAVIMATQLNRTAWIGAAIGALIGVFIGSSVGIAAAGTATSGIWLFAILGFIIGGFSGKAIHDGDRPRSDDQPGN